tara:strand:- start:3359 stop:3604 length:246 start_codon:yes stop_codon:yes gene_type:complete
VNFEEDGDLILRAAIEFGPDYTYTIRYGTLGLTLYVDAGPPARSKQARKDIPCHWEGLRVIVLCTERAPPETKKVIYETVE